MNTVWNTMTLRNKIIRLAHDKPDLRSDLIPLLKSALVNDKKASRLTDAISEMTEDNAHGEAVAHLAAHLRDKKAMKVVEAINVIHDFEGHMPRELLQIRNKLRDSLLSKASKRMSPEEFEALRMSF